MSPTSRIGFEQLPVELRVRLEPRVKRLGYLGEFFQVAAHQPEPLAAFIDFTEALKRALPARIVELIALTAAAETGNAYERVQHERLALKVGLSESEIRSLTAGDESVQELPAQERLVVELTRQVCAAQGRSCPAYDPLQGLAGQAVAVACLMTAVRYLAHATMANTWGLEPPVSSPFAVEPTHG